MTLIVICHHKSFDERQTDSNFILVGNVVFSEKIQQCYFFIEDTVLEKFPAGQSVRHDTHWINHDDLKCVTMLVVHAFWCVIYYLSSHLCSDAPVKPANITRMSEPRVHTMCDQHVCLHFFLLD